MTVETKQTELGFPLVYYRVDKQPAPPKPNSKPWIAPPAVASKEAKGRINIPRGVRLKIIEAEHVTGQKANLTVLNEHGSQLLKIPITQGQGFRFTRSLDGPCTIVAHEASCRFRIEVRSVTDDIPDVYTLTT